MPGYHFNIVVQLCMYVGLKEAMEGEIWKTFSLYWFVLCMRLKFIGLCVYARVHVLISMAKPRSFQTCLSFCQHMIKPDASFI